MEYGVQSNGPPEQSAKVKNAPAFQLAANVIRYMLNQKNGKSFRSDASSLKLPGKDRAFRALLHPPHQILADIEQHAQFGVPAAQ